MSSGPKPGDPDFKPRYPPLDLEPIEKRYLERLAVQQSIVRRAQVEVDAQVSASLSNQAEAIHADSEMIRDLLREVKNLREANRLLKEITDALGKTRASPTFRALAYELAKLHVQDGDEVGVMARKILEEMVEQKATA